MKTALVLGAAGFIGGHLVKRLKAEGYWVRGVDIKDQEYGNHCDEFVKGDLRSFQTCVEVISLTNYGGQFDEIYQLAADMGGAGYIFSGDHDADVMRNSAVVNLNVAYLAVEIGCGKIFYSSSACMYPQELQNYEDDGFTFWHERGLKESDAYPLNPDSDYGLEKAFSERLYMAYSRNYGLNVRIARFHNIYGPEGTWTGGKEKAPAAICRKVAEVGELTQKNFTEGMYAPIAMPWGEIEIWGDGEQTRSFLYIDDCLDAVRLLMESDFKEPINIGSEEMVSINQLAKIAIDISGKTIVIKHIDGPQGVRGRNSDNTLIRQVLGWEPKHSLYEGISKLYPWIAEQVQKEKEKITRTV